MPVVTFTIHDFPKGPYGKPERTREIVLRARASARYSKAPLAFVYQVAAWIDHAVAHEQVFSCGDFVGGLAACASVATKDARSWKPGEYEAHLEAQVERWSEALEPADDPSETTQGPEFEGTEDEVAIARCLEIAAKAARNPCVSVEVSALREIVLVLQGSPSGLRRSP